MTVKPTSFSAVVREWLTAGRDDVGLWALEGLGIDLSAPQREVAQKLIDPNSDARYHLLTWANRAGKTTVVGVTHMHRLWYRLGLPKAPADDPRGFEQWAKAEYRTLHTAPLNELAGRAFAAWGEIIKGTSMAQRVIDESGKVGKLRDAPLADFFTTTRERTDEGADRMFLRCKLTGAVCDFRSTEGKATRLEGGNWRYASWDEWPQQENKDDIRTVLNVRLTNRVADYDGRILLTGTLTDETEHIAADWLARCEDADDPDWWGNHAERSSNPSANKAAIERALRNLDPEDYARTVLGQMGGVRGRLFPSFMLEPVFQKGVPRYTPPVEGDGALYDEKARGFRSRSDAVESSPWTYLHLWDVAIAEADNVGTVWRIPRDWRFSVENPIIGVHHRVIPGSRTLTSAEIIHTVEETYLPYGGLIVVDTTDAHGKNIARELRQSGYPVEEFTFNERDAYKIIRKDAAIRHLRDIMSEGMALKRDARGEPEHDADGVPVFDRTVPYGALGLSADWQRDHDQLAVLKELDKGQRKDHAMTHLMGAYVAMRKRKSITRQEAPSQRLAWSGRGRVMRSEVRGG